MICRAFSVILVAASSLHAQSGNLPTSKKLGTVVPKTELVNSLPTAVALSPDHLRFALIHTGYGSNDNDGDQSITVVDARSGALKESNEARLKLRAKQTFSFGIAFSPEGQRIYAPFGSISDANGNGIGVYRVQPDNALVFERMIALSPVTLAVSKQGAPVCKGLPTNQQVSFPAGVASFTKAGREKLIVAEQLSDTVALVDAQTGQIEARLDVGRNQSVPAEYPYNVVVDSSGDRAYVSLWNGSQVVEIDLRTNQIGRRFTLLPPREATESSSHPAALALDTKRHRLYVALANRDRVASIQLEGGRTEYAATGSKDLPFGGLYPNGLALTDDGNTLFASNASQNSVAVFAASESGLTYKGAFPTAWYPTMLATVGDSIYVATAKANSTGPNKGPRETSEQRSRVYGPRLLRGSVTKLKIASVTSDLDALTRQVEDQNLYRDAQTRFEFAGGKNPIKHVLYIIKENRTYDQVFGDLKEANGDPSLVMYGEEITPNQHALARQFGILDNFYDSGEVSGNGHVWSTAAITSDYTERIWPINYRGGQRTYDFEGNVENKYPLQLGISDVNEPGTGYLWGNLARNHRTYRHYGEFVETTWCTGGASAAPEAEEDLLKHPCLVAAIPKGGTLPAGGASPYPWQIPLIFRNTATKPELREHFDPQFADFNLDYPDQLRADEFIREFKQFEQNNSLPDFVLMRLPNDHTSGAKAGKPAPKAAVADNDLALGRVVEAVSHSKYWEDTAIFVIEDDAQDGGDHVDSHRSLALVISKYSPGSPEKPFVESGFYTTVNMLHTIEALLELPPMNANDAYAPVMSRMFSGAGKQAPFVADHRNEENGLMYTTNPAGTTAAKQSARLDFSHADAADSAVLNRILWHDARGSLPAPRPQHRVIPASLQSGRDRD